MQRTTKQQGPIECVLYLQIIISKTLQVKGTIEFIFCLQMTEFLHTLLKAIILQNVSTDSVMRLCCGETETAKPSLNNFYEFNIKNVEPKIQWD